MATETPVPLSGMDRPRVQKASRRHVSLIAAAASLLVFSALIIAAMRPAVPSVDRGTVVIDTVKRGGFVREVAAAGTLVAQQSRLIAAPTAGRVEQIHIENGQEVAAGDLLVTLTNRDATKELLEGEQQLAVAEADLVDLVATLQARSLEFETLMRKAEFESRDAARRSEAAAQLAREGLISNLEALRAKEASEEVAQRVRSEQERRRALAQSAAAQVAAQRNRIERLRALRAFHRDLVDSLAVRTPVAGTVREILVQDGESVTEGQRLFRLVERGGLEAILQVPEAEALEIRPGQHVTINARGTALVGIVKQVAPAVEQGTVGVEVELRGPATTGLRPDLSVEGRIEISRSPDVLTVTRPANAAAHGPTTVYRLESRNTAKRTKVTFGAASVDRVVITSGARAGDRLIIAGLESQTEPAIKLE